MKALLIYILLAGVVLFLALFLLMFLSYKHFVRKIEKQRRENLRSMIEVQERERRAIALEVHDNLAPLLSITNMQIESLMIGDKNENIKAEMTEVYDQLKSAINICRDISHELTPILNNKISLEQMIREYLQKINASGKISAGLSYDIGGIKIPQQKAASICRVVLELLTNTVKHAKAEHADIDIAIKDAQLILTYTDDGIGMQKKTGNGIGMKNIQSRIALFNGTLQINQPSKGIRIVIKLPINEFDKQ